jgi:ferritin-like metal-binding protein YciE
MIINSMRDLLVHELHDLLSAERQLIKALPKLEHAASSPKLAAILRDHLLETERHEQRLDECFSLLNEKTRAMKCKGMEGLIKECSDTIDKDWNESVRDAALIAAVQRLEHYEITAYGTAAEIAGMLGEEPVAELLRETLEEEKAGDKKLTALAESEINPKAMMVGEPAGL